MRTIHLYRTPSGTVVVLTEGTNTIARTIPRFTWNTLINHRNPFDWLLKQAQSGSGKTVADPARASELLPPLWHPATLVRAVGCSHARSAEERTRLHLLQSQTVTEAAATVGQLPDPVTGPYLYVRVAPVCEVFEKGCGAQTSRFVGVGGRVLCVPRHLMVTETEFCLLLNSRGQIIGVTIMNDFTIHSLEAECTLYLPQAKGFDGCAALGPGVYIFPKPIDVVPGGPFPEVVLPPETEISLMLKDRGGVEKFSGKATFGDLARPAQFYADHASRRQNLSAGMYLSMGTGIIHPKGLGVSPGDQILMSCPLIGTLNHGAGELPDYPDYRPLV